MGKLELRKIRTRQNYHKNNLLDMPVPLVLVSNSVTPLNQYQWEVDNDLSPRVDYLEIAKKIGGETLGYENHKGPWYKPIRDIENRLKIDFIEAFRTAKKFSEFNLYLSASEKSGIPLSFLMSALREEAPHILIGHHLSSIPKTRLYKYWKFREHVSHVICVSQAQADFAVNSMKFPVSSVDFIFDKVDHKFFHPEDNENGDYILAIGQEQRDYKTLIEAIDGTDIHLVIVASSPWSQFNLEIVEKPNVTLVSKIPYTELRDLYNGAKLVVVPLFENSYGAGLNTLLEAMAMAKPLIITKTEGIDNYVQNSETGLQSSPEDSLELKEHILRLMSDSKDRMRLGSNARQVIEDQMNIDFYVENIVEIISSYI
jgi:glycosyltransferase involved in cell wall biosynthesis